MDDAAYENARKLVPKYADLISQEIQSVEFRFWQQTFTLREEFPS